MKIICIGRNYAKHAYELANETPKEPVFFLKPDTAIPQTGYPFFIPDFSENIHYEVEVVVRINRLGKHIDERFAHKYYSDIGLGIDFTARDLQEKLKSQGLPWEKAKGFDGSAAVSKHFISKDKVDVSNLNFSLVKNGKIVQQGNTKDMLFTIDKLIAYISTFITIKIGDLIFTGTPSGVGSVVKGDLLEGYVQDEKMLKVRIK
ncbi:MAG: fumarylacetoacetate hydrolase family protein [Bacteroidota bacterium]|nr:fumarylacetoacetate hydrolase family protein [Bacteroidota bacterium]